MTWTLAAESIGKSLGRQTVLTSAGLWASRGKISVLLGRNGSGKTTLVKIAVGWLRPDYGVVMFEGEHIARPSLSALASRGLCYVPDRSLLCRNFTLEDHFAAVEHHIHDARTAEAIDVLRLHDLLKRKSRSFSGGELRRAELGIALARAPTCLVADEPFRELMPTDADLICDTFRQIADSGCAVVVTGHEVETLLGIADLVLWQTAGTTHYIGDRMAATVHDQFKREYLGKVAQ